MLGHSNRNGTTAQPALAPRAADSGALIAPGTPLTRLSYFDGKLLRASDLTLEQSYLRALVHLSNQASGAGVVHGYEVALTPGDSLRVEAGLAIDPTGRLLLLNEGTSLSINKLIAEGERIRAAALGTRATPASSATANGASGTFQTCPAADRASPTELLAPVTLYLVSLAHAEDYCGQENVYGAICEPACATTSQRPYVVEGVVVQVTPLDLPLLALPPTGLIIGRHHLRSRVASAYFAAESQLVPSLISAAGLNGGQFCLGAELAAGAAVPVAILGRSGNSTTFLDSWTVRRERIEAPPRRYWASRMALRPLDAFLAQVLQFQCQLPSALQAQVEPEGRANASKQALGGAASAVKEAYTHLERIARALRDNPLPASVSQSLGLDGVDAWMARYTDVEKKLEAARAVPVLSKQVLIQGGILELPSAGYLPVLPLAEVSVNEQVASLLGEGVDLRFSVVRPDFVPHALEEAQHMERISLLEGLADPTKKPKLEVLVPDGLIEQTAPEDTGVFEATFTARSACIIGENTPEQTVRGLARAVKGPKGACGFHFAGTASFGADVTVALLMTLTIGPDPFELPAGGKSAWLGRIVAAAVNPSEPPVPFLNLSLVGSLQLSSIDAGERLDGTTDGGLLLLRIAPTPPPSHGALISSPIVLSRSMNAGSGECRLEGNNIGKVEVRWEGHAATVHAEAGLDFEGSQLKLIDVIDLIADPGALDPSSEPRQLASRSIEILSTAFANEPQFQTLAELALFGPRTTPSQLITTVRARRDWVLFHRSRDKVVGQTQPSTVPAPAPHPDPTPEPPPADFEPVRLRIILVANSGFEGGPIPAGPRPDLTITIDKYGVVTIPERDTLASDVTQRGRVYTDVDLVFKNPEASGASQYLDVVVAALREITAKVEGRIVPIVRDGNVGTIRAPRPDEMASMMTPPPVGGLVVIGA